MSLDVVAPSGFGVLRVECQTVPVNNLPPPRVSREVGEALQSAWPLLQAANATQQKIIALLREVKDEGLRLTSEERATRQREIDELREQMGREKRAARRPMEELKARYPQWINLSSHRLQSRQPDRRAPVRDLEEQRGQTGLGQGAGMSLEAAIPLSSCTSERGRC